MIKLYTLHKKHNTVNTRFVLFKGNISSKNNLVIPKCELYQKGIG